MIHLVLDTSIYRADPNRKKAAFIALLKLGANGYVKLHMPYIVEREFKSQRLEEYEFLFKPIDDSINTLKRKRLPENLIKDISKQALSLKKIQNKTIRFIEKELVDWIVKMKANRCRLLPGHSRRMWEAYFAGLPPFSNKKARTDIPDSFVFETIRDLSNKYKELVFVCGDERLRKSAERVVNKTYSSLEDFIASEECQNILLEHSVKEYTEGHIVLQMKDNHQIFEKAINDLYLDALVGKTLGDQSIPDDNQSATINGVDAAVNVSIEYDQTSYYGDGLLVVPFSLDTEVLADYYIFKSDYYCMDEEKTKHISITDWNDHYFAAEEDFFVHVSGFLTFEIDIKKLRDEKDIKNLLKVDSFKIDSLESIELAPSTNTP
ncbi:MAG: PIN domain-containing protein [Candidatus Omnitrophota bacterium]